MLHQGYDRKYETCAVIFFFIAWGFVFLDRLAISFLTPVLAPALNLTNANIGMVGLVTTGCYAVSAVIIGGLSDKSGYRKRWLIPFLFATALFSALSATVQTYNQLLIVRGLVGLAEGPIAPIMFAMVSNLSSEQNFGRNTGIINMGVSVIGVTLGPVFVTQLLGVASWQMAFLISALPSLVMAVISIKVLREVEIDPQEADTEEKRDSGSFVEVLKYRNIVVCCVVGIFCMAGYWGLMLFAPLFWVNVGHISVQNMGFMTSGMGIMCIIWAVAVPKFSDHLGRKPIMTIALLFCALVPLGMYLFKAGLPGMGLYFLFGGLAGATQPFFVTLIPMESVPERLKATADGLILGVSEVVGGAVFPPIAGKVADLYGLPSLMMLCAIAFALAFIISFAVLETHGPKANKAALEKAV